MAELTPRADPGEVGMDADRPARIDQHFARYVDDGRLAGLLTAVTRRGRVVHVGAVGRRGSPRPR